MVRSDSPARLTADGWSTLHEYGIRTIIALRTHGMVENELNISAPYPDVATVQVEIEDITDQEFLQQWAITNLWGTPLYYQDALQRWPARQVAAIRAIAQAGPGGVLFHCIRGHDRTGIIAMLMLALVGASPEDIVRDYELSIDPKRDEILHERGTTNRKVIMETLDHLEVESYLLSAGLSRNDLEAARARLLEP
jgi:hypothetical protein